MGYSYNDPQQSRRNFDPSKEGPRSGFRSGRGSNNREAGGFRIRLSDNEMRAARSIQEAFNLRSTVAVLGFALRTVGEMLEEGKFEEIIKNHRENSPRSQNPSNPENHLGERTDKAPINRNKANPFARPDKPEPSTSTKDINEEQEDADSKDVLAKENSEETIEEEIKTNEKMDTTDLKDDKNEHPSS
tara:strand:+ start:7246 stop:7809 length:564 start_codon:yes stop_codon:yes gene_type:complete